MMFQNGYIKKICSVYDGECHLAAMIFPYITKKIKEKANIELLLDENINKYLNKFLENVNIKKETKESIQKINWNNCNLNEQDLEMYISEKLKPNQENIFIMKINEDESIYKQLIEIIKRKSYYIIKNNIRLNIIFCYNIEKLKSIDNIINKYEYVLNTSGVHEIKEVFECKVKKDKDIVKDKYVV